MIYKTPDIEGNYHTQLAKKSLKSITEDCLLLLKYNNINYRLIEKENKCLLILNQDNPEIFESKFKEKTIIRLCSYLNNNKNFKIII